MMNWDAFKNHDGTYYVHREYNKPMPDAELGQEATQNRKKFKKLRTVSGDELMKKTVKPARFVVNGLLPRGLNIVAGKRKEGKSWLMLDLCFSVAEGEKFLDHDTEQGTVLYLDLEDPESRLIQRARGIRDVIPSGFHEATKAGRLGGGLTEQIEDFVKEHPDTNLVVIDTLQKIRKPKGDTYAGDYAVISALKNLADRLDIAIVCIHHTRKMKAKDTFDSVLGSTGLTAAADGIYVLERKADGKPFGRLSFISRDLPDGDLPVRFDHDTCRWYLIASSDMERELLLADEAMSALVSFMKQELIYEGTATELCERLGLNIGANNLSSKLSKYKSSLQKLGVDYTKEKRNNHKVFTLNYNPKKREYDGTMKSAYTPEAMKKPGEKPFVGISENGLHRTA
ncbi:AAA family ATPase [Ruminococcus sp.]|uniref:AAA family ATPase n=1 Tax=Ruminococcus sp. TaxID=41978 RepID=UPI00388F5BE2